MLGRKRKLVERRPVGWSVGSPSEMTHEQRGGCFGSLVKALSNSDARLVKEGRGSGSGNNLLVITFWDWQKV
jgi:hypothetical protein